LRLSYRLGFTAAAVAPGFTARARRPLRSLGLRVPGLTNGHAGVLSFSFGPLPVTRSYYGLC
jgi:hypothetical protein